MNEGDRSEGQLAPSQVLSIEDLTLEGADGEGSAEIVDRLSMSIVRGETLGLIGESGSGKSVTALAIAGLLPDGVSVAGGTIRIQGVKVDRLTEKQWRPLRGREVGMVFQDSINSLDPLFKVGDQLVEAMRAHRSVSRRAAWDEAEELLRNVGIPDPSSRLRSYPHELSGGMAQRVAIAIAVCNGPSLLIADEPTTALDVTVQKQILRLIKRIQVERKLSVLFISHDLGVVAALSDRIAVMYAGRIVESGRVSDVAEGPLHPYTRALLRSQPKLGRREEQLVTVPGSVPAPGQRPSGCRFHPRCSIGSDEPICREQSPDLYETTDQSHRSACHFWTTLSEPIAEVRSEG